MSAYHYRRLYRLPRLMAKCQRGAAAVEFSLVAVPFLGLILVSLQFFVLFFAQQILETATEAAGRQILTGQSAGQTQAQFQNAVCQQIHALLNCSGIMVDVQSMSTFDGANTSAPTLTYDKNGNVTNVWVFQPGSAGDIVVFRAMYQWPMFNIFGFNPVTQQNGTHLMMATAVFKNEIYN